MTDNEKIAQWGNWPLFNKENPAAIPWMLETLVMRGYGITLNGSLAGDWITFDCHIRHKPKQVISVVEPTVAAAISAAILELIADET